MNKIYHIIAIVTFFNIVTPAISSAENYTEYATDRWGVKKYIDMDSLKLVTKNRSLVYVTTKGVYPVPETDGTSFYISKELRDCSQEYSEQIFWGIYTFDNVPLKVQEKKQLNEAIEDALSKLDTKFEGHFVADELKQLCKILSRWTYEYSQRADIQTLTDSIKPTSLSSVPITKSGGVYHVKAAINGGISLTFVVDSGAADVVLPEYIGKTLFASGTLTKSDIVGTAKYTLANGSPQFGTVVNLKFLRIGDVVIKNVRASILPGDSASFLLGQSALKKLGSWRINVESSLLEIGNK